MLFANWSTAAPPPLQIGSSNSILPRTRKMGRDIFHADRNGCTRGKPFPTGYCHLFKHIAGMSWWKLRSVNIILCIFRSYLASTTISSSFWLILASVVYAVRAPSHDMSNRV